MMKYSRIAQEQIVGVLKALMGESAKLKKLLAEAILGVSTLHKMLGKTAEAWLTAFHRDLGHQ